MMIEPLEEAVYNHSINSEGAGDAYPKGSRKVPREKALEGKPPRKSPEITVELETRRKHGDRNKGLL